jgi:hypothetical protein
MSDEMTMRARLQHVAAYRELRRSVQRSGRENVLFALLMLGLAYYMFQLNGQLNIVFLLYVGLALAELAAGLFKVLIPSAEGVLLDAFILLLFAGWNIGWQALALGGMGLRQPNPVILFLGLYMLFGAFGRFKAYGQLRRLFAEKPAPEHIAWFDDLVHEIQASDPHTDPLALDLPTRPRWKAKLLGNTAFFVATGGSTVWVAGVDEFVLKREKSDHGTGRRKAILRIHGAAYPEFDLEDVSWANYTKWLATQPVPQPAT